MRRFGHGHSLALGAILTLALERHWLVFACLIFVAGLACGRAWATWTIWASALREKWHLARAEKIRLHPEPVYSGRGKPSPSDEIPF